MNLVDVLILVIIAVCVLDGVYKGFLHSLFGVGAFFLSWLTSICFYPMLARQLDSAYGLATTLSTYVEGADHLGAVENARMLVHGMGGTDLSAIVGNADFALPFPELIKQNVRTEAFSDLGLTTLGEYTNRTISIVVINLMCFLAIFIVARLVFGFAINAADKTAGFPMLKQFDPLLGGAFGLVSGVFMTFVVFMLVPAFFAVQSLAVFKQYFEASFMGSFFYNSNFILNGIRGIL